jgi:hypothetical protein
MAVFEYTQAGIAYVVYPPPYKGLPYLAVTLFPDGMVVARQFETEDEAVKYSTDAVNRRGHRGRER